MKISVCVLLIQCLFLVPFSAYAFEHPGYMDGKDASGNDVHYTFERGSDMHYDRVEHLSRECSYGRNEDKPSEGGRDWYHRGPMPDLNRDQRSSRNQSEGERKRKREASYLSERAAQLGQEIEEFSQNVESDSRELLASTTAIENSEKQNEGFGVSNQVKIPERLSDRDAAVLNETIGPRDTELLHQEGLIAPPLAPAKQAHADSPSQRLNTLLSKFSEAHPQNPQGYTGKSLGILVLAEAEKSMQAGDLAEAEDFMNLASSLLDIALGVIPGVSMGKDALEAITGYGVVTGERLDGTERSMALLGVASFGFSGGFKSGMKALGRLSKSARLADFSKKIAGGLSHALRKANRLLKTVATSVGGDERSVRKLVASAQRMSRKSITFKSGKEARDTVKSVYPANVASSANRFFKRATAKSTEIKVTKLGENRYRFEHFSPANNPGYGKRYVKEVNLKGETLSNLKQTIGPKGAILETKYLEK